jgi:hypothetical protein
MDLQSSDKPKAMDSPPRITPTIGRIVHFVQKRPAPWQDQPATHLPAIITAVWGENCVNLQVFTDGFNSEPSQGENVSPTAIHWVTSVSLDDSAEPQPRTWHWPERS